MAESHCSQKDIDEGFTTLALMKGNDMVDWRAKAVAACFAKESL